MHFIEQKNTITESKCAIDLIATQWKQEQNVSKLRDGSEKSLDRSIDKRI